MANKIQFRRDTAANWTSANPTLSQGELGFETDTNKFKLGNGSTAWNSLDYTFNPSITADQNLNTTSNVTFANVTVPSTVTVDRLAKYGAGFANIEIAEDDNLTPQTDLRSDLGISGKRFGRAYLNTTTVGTKVIFPDASEQTTAWTGSVAYSNVTGRPNQSLDTTSSPTFANLTVNGTMTTLNVTTENVTTENIVTQNFADGTSQTTAWTGTVASSQITAVSTSKVTGLSVVGYTGNWSDLIGAPPSYNQSLNNTDAVQFSNIASTGGISATTGTRVQQVISAGGYPLDSNGQALIQASSTQTPAMVVSNYTTGLLPRAVIRGYGQNTPGGGASTSASPGLSIEGSRGTSGTPTAVGNADNIGFINFGGYDGSQWASNQGTGWSPFTFAVNASEAWANNGTTTTNAGAQFIMRTQPPATQLNSTSRQVFMGNSWTAGSTSTLTPPQMNLYIGMTAAQNSTLVPASGVGSFGTGSGATSMAHHSVKAIYYGVTNNDTAPDNAGITGTNVLLFVSNRRSAFAGRRDPLVSGDTIFALNGNVQTAASQSGNGSLVSVLASTMVENAGSTARGTRWVLQTVNTGTTTLATRLALDDRLNDQRSDTHKFSDKTGTFPALTMTTSSAAFGTGVAITTYNRTYAEVAYTGTTIVATATNTIYAFPLNTTNVANGIVLQNGQQIKFNQVGGGFFKIIMSLQAAMATNSIGSCDFWLRKNGVDVPNSATQVDLLKDQKAVIPMDWLVTPSVNDYYEIVYAVNDTNLQFPWYAEQTSPYARPSVPPIIVNVIPAGA